MSHVPRDRLSEAAVRVAQRRTEYTAHLEWVRASQWRLGCRGGWWQVARCGTDTDGWIVLDEQLRAFPDIDPVAERRRVASWLHEVLEVRSAWWWRDYAAAAAGRVAYEVEIKS